MFGHNAFIELIRDLTAISTHIWAKSKLATMQTMEHQHMTFTLTGSINNRALKHIIYHYIILRQ